MNKLTHVKTAAALLSFYCCTLSCNPAETEKTTGLNTDSSAVVVKADPAQLKEEMQALETAWANADNARDVDALAAFYADDAISMVQNQPSLVGMAAIRKDIEASMAKRAKGTTIAYDVMDAYGAGDYATEVGKVTRKDSTGKVGYTGKYMAIWEKRNGKWLCIRDISNDDVKAK